MNGSQGGDWNVERRNHREKYIDDPVMMSQSRRQTVECRTVRPNSFRRLSRVLAPGFRPALVDAVNRRRLSWLLTVETWLFSEIQLDYLSYLASRY